MNSMEILFLVSALAFNLMACGEAPKPMVALVFGQSNAANFNETQNASKQTETFMFQDGNILPMADPISDANGTKGSVWPLTADLLRASGVFNKVTIINVAVGGTNIDYWANGDGFAKIAGALRTLRENNLEPTHILMHQGESDAVQNTDAGVYEQKLTHIITTLQNKDFHVTAPFFISHATICQNTQNEHIRAAQFSTIQHNENTYAGPDTDIITLDQRWDKCHFNNEGQHIAASLWSEAILNPSKSYQGVTP